MTVKELKESLATVDENLVVALNYRDDKANGFYIDDRFEDRATLIITELKVRPLA